MAGFINNGLPLLASIPANAVLNVDTQNPAGENPESGAISALALAISLQALRASGDLTTVAGSRYYTNVTVGAQQQFTGIAALIGSVGGTDKFIFELHNSAGVLVATTALAGVTVGTAATLQYIPFTAPYIAPAGNYFIAIQSNGTTAHPAVLTNPNLGSQGVVSGSATGTFGTSASITPPTTYTASLAPVAFLY